MKSVWGILVVSVCVSAAYTPAHAGMFDFVDNIFTFREDQRGRITPRQNIRPQIVQVPYFNTQEQAQWSHYYTRPDLVPQEYLDGSGSMVVRPNVNFRQAQRYPQGVHPASWQNMQHRSQQIEALASGTRPDGRIYIGEPNTTPYQADYVQPSVGKRTEISQPARSWRDQPEDRFAQARPGDFDYQRPQPRENAYSERTGAVLHGDEHRDDWDSGTVIYGDGAADSYRVRPGDTLSGISDQKQVYGNWQMWPLIYDANRGVIQNPDVIYPEQNLDIPRDYSPADAANARQRARTHATR